MKRMIANAAPWSFALKEQYLADFPEDPLWEVYGSTELRVDTWRPPACQGRQRAYRGEMGVGKRAGRSGTEPNVPGEVFVRSANNFVDYHKATEKFAASRRDDF